MKELYFKFDANTEKFTTSPHDYVNSFIQKIVKKHDQFSEYSVSQLQGGKLDENGLIQFPNGAVLVFRSANDMIYREVNTNLYQTRDVLTIQTMKLKEISTRFMSFNDDVILIDRLALKNENDKYITYKNYQDLNDFVELLTNHCKRKLKHYNISTHDIDTFKIIPVKVNDGDWSTSYVKIHETKNKKQGFVTSNIKVKIEGEKHIKRILIKNGFGMLTGYGCGFAKQYNTILNIKEINNSNNLK